MFYRTSRRASSGNNGAVITVADHDPAWADQFEALRSGYREALAGVPVVGIEHVGSTSVPGLAAKPIIDIDIIVGAEHVQPAIEAMQRAGFRSSGEQGIADRWALAAPPGLPRTNTYVVVDGCLALRNHLAVRDLLRNDDDLSDEYAAVKRAIASNVDDIDHYGEQKTDFLTSVLERAGLTEAERTQIEHANRSS